MLKKLRLRRDFLRAVQAAGTAGLASSDAEVGDHRSAERRVA